jgi:hypothetical protein
MTFVVITCLGWWPTPGVVLLSCRVCPVRNMCGVPKLFKQEQAL